MRNYFAIQFAVFVYVIVMYVKMPQCNFSDEIKKKKKWSWILNLEMPRIPAKLKFNIIVQACLSSPTYLKWRNLPQNEVTIVNRLLRPQSPDPWSLVERYHGWFSYQSWARLPFHCASLTSAWQFFRSRVISCTAWELKMTRVCCCCCLFVCLFVCVCVCVFCFVFMITSTNLIWDAVAVTLKIGNVENTKPWFLSGSAARGGVAEFSFRCKKWYK